MYYSNKLSFWEQHVCCEIESSNDFKAFPSYGYIMSLDERNRNRVTKIKIVSEYYNFCGNLLRLQVRLRSIYLMSTDVLALKLWRRFVLCQVILVLRQIYLYILLKKSLRV